MGKITIKKETAKELKLKIAQLEKEKQKLQDKLHKPIKDSSDELKKVLTNTIIDKVDSWELLGNICDIEIEMKSYDEFARLSIELDFETAKRIIDKANKFREKLECYR